jgi:uridine phosphorylase
LHTGVLFISFLNSISVFQPESALGERRGAVVELRYLQQSRVLVLGTGVGAGTGAIAACLNK